MAKINYMHSLHGKEWSGNVIYFTREEEEDVLLDDGSIKKQNVLHIDCEDIALMEYQGTEAFTKFVTTDKYANNYCLMDGHKWLIGSYIGLLHSHHTLGFTTHSGTDIATLKKEGASHECNNFLSVIVSKDYKVTPWHVYITQRVSYDNIRVSGEKIENVFGDDNRINFVKEVTKEKYPEEMKGEIVEIINVEDIEYSEPSWTESERAEFLERVEELKKKEEEARKPKTVTYSTGFGSEGSTYPRFNNYENDYFRRYNSNSTVTNTNYAMYQEKINGVAPSEVVWKMLNLSVLSSPSSNWASATELSGSIKKFNETVGVVFSIPDYELFFGTFIETLFDIYSNEFKEGHLDSEFEKFCIKSYTIACITCKEAPSAYTKSLLKVFNSYLYRYGFLVNKKKKGK